MTWNVENLFDVGAEAGPDTQAQLAAKLKSLAAVVDAQEPHVVALQEIGSEAALAKLQAELDQPMPHRALANPDDRKSRSSTPPGGSSSSAASARACSGTARMLASVFG
jgi:Endonuclease/Exonuclease/phosphatase family